MAATDQKYRNQKTLDIVFAVSSILTLLSILWMLVQDYNRPFKKVQREFRDVEEAVFDRALVEKLPPADKIKSLETAEKMLAAAKDQVQGVRKEHGGAIRQADAKLAEAENDYSSVKAKHDSQASLYNIDLDNADRAGSEADRQALYKRADARWQVVLALKAELNEKNEVKEKAKKAVEQAERPVKDAERAEARKITDFMLDHQILDYSAGPAETLGEVQDNLKKATGEFDRFAKLAATKRWTIYDDIRKLPILDAFASPTRIQQYTLNDLPIDYSFKYVTRFDRCTTCHLGAERANFDRATLASLGDQKYAESKNKDLGQAIEMLKERESRGESLGFDPDDLPSKYTWPVGLITIILLVLAVGGAAALGYVKKSSLPALGILFAGLVLTLVVNRTLAHFSPRQADIQVVKLTDGQVTEFCAHPRLDLFVDSNSPHSAEKFGCTICHAGQGSATEFDLAAHTPNSSNQKKAWVKEHGWESQHFWDYPMLASRFVESSCIKCHHQVTDLVRYGSREEAPKLLRGFALIRENGCFGCHEIAGVKSGRPVGPDLRLEPNVLPLQALTPAERTVALADPLNPPGTMRKVGPSLYRLAEKTNEEWVRKWVQSPRTFRPDTKMPHFYGLSTNSHDYLAKEAPAQAKFPDAEINAIAYYLMTESRGYLEGKDTYRTDNLKRYNELHEREKKEAELREKVKDAQGEEKKELDNELLQVALTEKERKELAEITSRLKMAGRYALLQKVLDGRLTPDEVAQRPDQELIDQLPVALAKEITDGEGHVVQLPPYKDEKKRLARGNRLFREKGCLACHTHDAVKEAGTDEFGKPLPAIPDAQADFGPNLTRLAAKLGKAQAAAGTPDEAARRWLVQWVMNPKVHHPRTRMPVTHLGVDEAADVADWLLAQKVTDWNEADVPAPDTETLKELVKVALVKIMPLSEAEAVLQNGFSKAQLDAMKPDAEERRLAEINDDNLKWYAGKRAINRLGCFGCHSVPGFELAKPIGTPLNDWGKKDPERLAFEDVDAYVKDQIHAGKIKDVPLMIPDPKKGFGPDVKEGQEAYEQFFLDSLEHHQREGFLHQKLMEPRSYDYHRNLTWDDRLRMPQFRFARGAAAKPLPDEPKEAAEARAEAQAREAVMTFVLGLVAEPIPLQFVHRPTGDKLAEAKGRLVLDTMNCAGCHQVRPGVYDFKRSEDVLKLVRERGKEIDYAKDYFFADHNAWASEGPLPDRVRLFGMPQPAGEAGKLAVRLTRAVRADASGQPDDGVRAAETISDLAASDLIASAAPYGGTFVELMVPYLQERRIDAWNNADRARAALPPPLIREGERVQPEWLYQFLRNPGTIRPQFSLEGAVEKGTLPLRMPRFNMSPDDVTALVNYFAAVDRLENPSFGVHYPYLQIPQQESGFLPERDAQYKSRLPGLEKELRQKALPAAEAAVKAAAPGQPKADAEKKLDALKKLLDDYAKKEKEPHAFAQDAYRLLVAGRANVCLQCHDVGPLKAQPSPSGPPLDQVAGRLRPEWLERWLANPQRLFPYTPNMPQNYPRTHDLFQEGDQQLMVGDSKAHLTALRDILMLYPKAAALPENRDYRPPAAGGK